MNLSRLAPLFIGSLLMVAGCTHQSAGPKEDTAAELAAASDALDAAQPERAIELATKVIEVEPQNPAAYRTRAEARRQTRDLPGALEDADKALELDANDPQALAVRGRGRRDQKDTKGALADFDHSLELDPKQATLFNDRGLLHTDSGLVADFDKAIALNPKYAEAYYNRAMARLAAGGPDNVLSALDDLSKAIKCKPDYAQAYNARGKLYELPSIFRLPEGARRFQSGDQARSEIRRGVFQSGRFADRAARIQGRDPQF